ncbi:hypothetical protein AADZ90_019815 [Aestuariibius sp. 2305UL40-4]|uniref:hypothetical protein n=1 Tax=Aestuariibius violaceus TaxID=3234132 RepID=UPI00345EF92F
MNKLFLNLSLIVRACTAYGHLMWKGTGQSLAFLAAMAVHPAYAQDNVLGAFDWLADLESGGVTAGAGFEAYWYEAPFAFPIDPGGSEDEEITLSGPSLSFEHTRVPLPDTGGLFVEFGGSFASLEGDDTTRVRLNDGGFSLASGTVPAGSLDISTSGASATWSYDIEDGPSAFGSGTSGPDGSITDLAFSPSENGSALVTITTDGAAESAGALALLVGAEGYALIGAGDDLSDSEALAYREVSVDTGELRMLFGRTLERENGWTVTPRFGPVFGRTQSDSHQSLRFDIAEAPGAVRPLPTISITDQDELDTKSIGIVAAAAFERQIADRWSMQIGLEAAVKHNHSDLVSRTRVSIPDLSDTRMPATKDDASGVSVEALTSLDFSYQLDRGGVLTVGVFGSYTSGYPTVERHGSSGSGSSGGGSASYVSDGSGSIESRVGETDLWNYGVHTGFTFFF